MFRKADKVSNVLFYAALILAEIGWMFVKVKYISDFCSTFIDIAIILLVICCAIQSRKYSIRSIFLAFSSVIIFSVNAIIISNATLLLLLLFCLAAKNIDLKKLIKFNWKFQLVLIVIVLICYYAGATDVYMMYRESGAVRSSMGFSHPNTFGAYIFSVFCQLIYSEHEKIKIPLVIALTAILTYLIAATSDSRSSVIALFIISLLTIIIKIKKYNPHISSIVKRILCIMPIIFMISSLVIGSIYDKNNQTMHIVNQHLSSRISSIHNIMAEYDATLFGQKLDLVSTREAKETGKAPRVLDNAYAKLVYQYGIVISTIFTLSYCLLIKKSLDNKDYILMAILITYIIRGGGENVLFNLYGNIFLLFFSRIIYDNTLPDKKTNQLTSNAIDGECDE